MVMDLLGDSLDTVYSKCHQKICLEDTLKMGLQMLESIEYVHSKKYLHRDMKPDNFVMGNKSTTRNKVYMIDYGLARSY